MKSILSIFFLLTGVSSSFAGPVLISSPSANKCDHFPVVGPPGVPGPAGLSAATAFGAFYTTEQKFVAEDELITFPTTATSLNVAHPNDTAFLILESGYYYINYGAASELQIDVQTPFTTLAAEIDGTPVDGGKIGITGPILTSNPLVSICFVIPLQAGQIITVRNVGVDFDLGFNDDDTSITAYINIIRLAPL